MMNWRPHNRYIPALFSLAMALALTVVAWIAVNHKVDRQVERRLSTSLEHVLVDLSEHFNLVTSSLRAAQSLLLTERNVTEERLRDFLETLDPTSESPRIIAIGIVALARPLDHAEPASDAVFSTAHVHALYPENYESHSDIVLSVDQRMEFDASTGADSLSIINDGLLVQADSASHAITLILPISRGPIRTDLTDAVSDSVDEWIAMQVDLGLLVEHVHGELELPLRLSLIDHGARGRMPLAVLGLPSARTDSFAYDSERQFGIGSHVLTVQLQGTESLGDLVGAGLPVMVLVLGGLLSVVSVWGPISLIGQRDERARLTHLFSHTVLKGVLVVTLAAGIIHGTSSALGLQASSLLGLVLSSGVSALLAMPLLHLWAIRPLEGMLAERIGESERNEEMIKQNENRLRRFLDHAPVMIWITDENGVCQHSNALIHEYTGQSRDEFAKRGWSDAVHPDHADWLESQWSKALASTSTFLVELRLNKASGGYRWALMQACPYFDSSGDLEGYIGICTDITDQKVAEEGLDIVQQELARRVTERTEALMQANAKLEMEISEKQRTEQELRHSETTLRAAQRMAHLGNWVWDIIENTVTWSHEVYRIVGRAHQDGNPTFDEFVEAVHPDDRDNVSAMVDLALQGQVDYRIEHRIVRPDGTIRTVFERGEITRDELGSPIRLVGTMLDITERKAAEDAQRRSEERVRLLLDSTAEAIYGLDLDGCCTFCNTACIELLGYESPEALLGLHMNEILAQTKPDGSPERSGASAILEACQRGEKAHADDEVIWRAGGTSFPAEYWSFPVRENGELIGSVVTFIDITDRKKADQALQDAHDELEKRVTERTSALRLAVEAAGNANEALNDKVEELETFNTLAVGRELRMIDLKHEINQLLEDIGHSPRYAPLEEEQLL